MYKGSVHVQYMFSTCSVHVQYMFSTCSVHVLGQSKSLESLIVVIYHNFRCNTSCVMFHTQAVSSLTFRFHISMRAKVIRVLVSEKSGKTGKNAPSVTGGQRAVTLRVGVPTY